LTTEPEYLDLDDLLGLAVVLLGDPPPVRNIGLLASAAARPRASAFGDDAYPGLWEKAAALLQSIVKDHPLVDGNKRLSWLATAVFLSINGVDPTTASNDAIVTYVMDAAAGSHTVDQLAERLRSIIEA